MTNIEQLIRNIDFHFSDDSEVTVSIAIHCQKNQWEEGERFKEEILQAIQLKQRVKILWQIRNFIDHSNYSNSDDLLSYILEWIDTGKVEGNLRFREEDKIEAEKLLKDDTK